MAAILLESTENLMPLSHQRLARGDSMHEGTPGCASPRSWMFCVLWVLGFLAGGAAGTSVAWLLASQSAQSTRGMMRRRLSDVAGFARDVKDRLIRRDQKTRCDARRRVRNGIAVRAGDVGSEAAWVRETRLARPDASKLRQA